MSTVHAFQKPIMKPPLRTAIIKCDTPLDVVDKFGKYGKIFKPFFNAETDALEQPDLTSSKDGS